MSDRQSDSWMGALFSRSGIVLVGFLGVAGYFLWTEHQAHVAAALPYLPWLLVLLCPLMHLFMHHGHGGHGGHGDHGDGDDGKPRGGPKAP